MTGTSRAESRSLVHVPVVASSVYKQLYVYSSTGFAGDSDVPLKLLFAGTCVWLCKGLHT